MVGMATRERVGRVAVDGAVTLDDVEAELWRRGLDAAGVDAVLSLVRRLAVADQVGVGASGGERLSEGPGAGVEGGWGLGFGPELAAELAGKQAGRERGEGWPDACACKRTESPVSRADLSTAFSNDEVGEGARACRGCRRELPAEAFYRKGAGLGRRATCKTCEGARRSLRRRELAAVRELSRRGVDQAALLALLDARRQADRERALVALRVASLDDASRALLRDAVAAGDERLAPLAGLAEGEPR